MWFAALITFWIRCGAQSGTVARWWWIFASQLAELPLLSPPDPVTEVPPPPASAGAVGSAIRAAADASSAPASLIRVLGFPRLERSCLGVCKIASLLRRPTGLAVGLALKELRPHSRVGSPQTCGSPAPRPKSGGDSAFTGYRWRGTLHHPPGAFLTQPSQFRIRRRNPCKCTNFRGGLPLGA